MEIGDELLVEDDADILDVIDIGFSRRNIERLDFFNKMDDRSRIEDF